MSLMTSTKSGIIKKTQSSADISEGDNEAEYDYTLFNNVVTDVCRKFNCPLEVIAKKVYQDDSYYRALKASKKDNKSRRQSVGIHRISSAISSTRTSPSVTAAAMDFNINVHVMDIVSDESSSSFVPTMVVTTVYDSQETLVEIIIRNVRPVPYVAMQVIGILATIQPNLTKFAIIDSRIDIHTIYELNKIVHKTYITDVSLEGLYLFQANYAVLLDAPAQLKYLTISKCRINDTVCSTLASKLSVGASASKTLLVLNLSSNQITDIGAKHIAQVLRTNRCLRHLNLADNQITDDGAIKIFETLRRFPLTDDEYIERGRRTFDKLRQRRFLYHQFLEQLRNEASSTEKDPKKGDKKPVKLKPIIEDPNYMEKMMQEKAYTMVDQIVSMEDPFDTSSVIFIRDTLHCNGNFVLCYLNLSYNNLSFISLTKLKSVLAYQKTALKLHDWGLMKVTLDGNCLSADSEEMKVVSYYLQEKLTEITHSKYINASRYSNDK